MSVQIANEKTINQAIEALLIIERRYSAHYIYKAIQRGGVDREDNLQKLGEELKRLNQLAYGERYNIDDAQPFGKYAHHYDDCKDIQALKSLQYLIYQCNESINDDNALLKELSKIEKTFLMMIVSNLPEYDKSSWGN